MAVPIEDSPEEMTLDLFEELNAQGTTPGVLEFRLNSLEVHEDAGEVTITVTRGGGTHGIVTVDYATVDGGAALLVPIIRRRPAH